MFIKAITGLMEYIAQGLIELVLTIFAYMGTLGRVVLDMPVVTTGIIFTQVLALSILALKVSYEALMTYILRQSGDPTSDPANLVVGTVRAASVIAVMPWIVETIYSFGLTLSDDIVQMKVSGSQGASNGAFTELLNLMQDLPNLVLFIAVGIIFAIVMFIIIIIQSFIRSAELAIVAWMGSFMALGLTNKQSQSWGSWFKEMITISTSGAIQLAMLKLSFNTLAPIRVPSPTNPTQMISLSGIVNLLLFIACLWVTYKAPNILKEKIHSTGLGRVGGSAGQMASQSIIMRMVARK